MKRKTFLGSLFGGAALGGSLVGCRAKPPAPANQPSRGKAEALGERILSHTSGAYFTAAAYIGDRLGLFKAMAGAGPLQGHQLAAKTGLRERYVLEWLRTMATSGYLDYHPETGTFELPPEHVSVLADENSATFLAGLIEGMLPDMLMAPRVQAAFKSGTGIPYGEYPPEVFESMERMSKPDYIHQLAQHWVPAIPGMAEQLRRGGSAADLGCGAGHAPLAIARAFPNVRAFGFEPYAPNVRRARENAQAEGLGGRVTFDVFDGVHVPGGPYQLITINYALHHAGKPADLLRSSRQALAPGGAMLVLECRRSNRLEEDTDKPCAIFYGIGLLECLPTALAEGGPGYGAGITEADMRGLAQASGFGQVLRLMPDDPLRSFFVLQA